MGLNEPSGFRGDTSVKIARTHETTQYSTAKLCQPGPVNKGFERERVRQNSTIPLNSVSQDQWTMGLNENAWDS